MAQPDFVIEPIVSQPFAQVSYVAWRKHRDDAIVVDPGFDPGAILDLLQREGRRLAAILNTHGHSDHIAGNAAMKSHAAEAPLIIGRNEAHLLTDPAANLSAAFGLALTSPPADQLVDDGELIEVAGFQLRIREISGHSPGSVVFVAEEFDPPFVFAGDVLFAGSVGRTDFPGGSTQALIAGIRRHLFALPDATLVLPGHGPTTTVGAERRSNPFVGEKAGTPDLA